MTHYGNVISIDFVIGLSISINSKVEEDNSILIIVDCLIKMVYYKPVTVSINSLGLAKAIINVVLKYHNPPDFIVSNQ